MPKNDFAHKINSAMLERTARLVTDVTDPIKTIIAEDEFGRPAKGVDRRKQAVRLAALSEDARKTGGAQKVLKICIGARVMLG